MGPEGSPFLEWEFLAGLEETGCVADDTGWRARPLTVCDEAGRLVGGAPVYLKAHSMGEYVFDQGWAQASERVGVPYYPKVLVAPPFTPVEGGRLLVHRDLCAADAAAVRSALVEALLGMCAESGLSSVHVNFCPEEDATALAAAGFLTRRSYQYRWENRGGWASWDDGLGALRSKRRKESRRERRAVEEGGHVVEMVAGDDVTPALMATMFELYERHLHLFGMWGRRYLAPEFFQRIAERWRERLVLAVARPVGGGEVVAAALHIRKGGALYGRYWGTFEDVPFLHFECCYYAAIEYCLTQGLRRFEAGAQGDFKRGRGLDARPTHSMHYLAHPGLRAAVSDFLERERHAVDETVEVLLAHTAHRRE